MSDWSIIVPQSTTNKVLNPSAEGVGNYSALNGGTVSIVTTTSFKGRSAFRCVSAATTQGIQFVSGALPNAAHYVTAMIKGTLPATWQWSLDNVNWTAPTLLGSYGEWHHYGAAFVAAQANGSTALRMRQSGAGSGDYNIDCIQVEAGNAYTTYCDGDQAGCSWSGTAHGSTSTRSAQSRDGGSVVDLEANASIAIMADEGIGMPDIEHIISESAGMAGATFEGMKVLPRALAISFAFNGSSISNLHSLRKLLVEYVKPDRVKGIQPLKLRYSGAGTPVEMWAYYDSGLGGSITGKLEKTSIRFIAYDPYCYGVGDSAKDLTASLSVANANYAISKVDGLWAAFANLAGDADSMAITDDGSVIIGGAFTSAGGVANTWGIARWYNGAFYAMGTGLSAGQVNVVKVGADGRVYAGGNFLTMGGVANTARIAVWNPITNTWAPLGTGATDNEVGGIDIAPDGSLYAVGSFTSMGGVANTTRVAKWTGSAWVALSTGLNNYGADVAVAQNGDVYIVGLFTTAGGVTCNGVTKWNGSAFAALSTGLAGSSATGENVVIAPNGDVFIGGTFTTAGGVTCNNIARWNGSAFYALGSGANGAVGAMAFDGSLLYVGGSFTQIGGLSLADRVAIWNGSVWAHLDADLPGSAYVFSIAIKGSKLYLGFNTAGTAVTSAKTTVTNSGSTTAAPKLVIKRAGGTSAILEWLRNETTGYTLWLNYSLLDGETLTVDFAAHTITSSYFGNVIGRALLPNSDFGAWELLPGDNDISLYVAPAGSPTITSYLQFKPRYWSADGVAV